MTLLSDVCPTCKRRKPRSVVQNRRYWALLTEAANKLGHTSDIWHEWFKMTLLPRRIIVINGEEKVINYPTHDLPMHPDINDPERPNWETYTMQTEAWLSERGVYLPE